jgi:LPS sulfotransferase NodH
MNPIWIAGREGGHLRPIVTAMVEQFPQVTSSYIIASTMRTGSYLLCEALDDTGVAGNPVEAFCPQFHATYCENWKLAPDVNFAEYFRGVIENSTTPNGVFGVKVHRDDIEPLAEECSLSDHPDRVLPGLFPSAKYIYLFRHDIRAQAISLYRASITNEWWRIPGEDNPWTRDIEPTFNATAILELEELLRMQNAAWKNFFETAGIEPLQLDYESLAIDYQKEVARVLAFLGQDPRVARELPPPRLVRQCDQTTDEWRRRLDKLPPAE